jgi:hypothetical protein
MPKWNWNPATANYTQAAANENDAMEWLRLAVTPIAQPVTLALPYKPATIDDMREWMAQARDEWLSGNYATYDEALTAVHRSLTSPESL